jgi:putative ABC transport system substrate-binding protein
VSPGSWEHVLLATFVGGAKHQLPAIYDVGEFVEQGGLMSYRPNFSDQFARAASYVDKILKGAKTGGLPVEQPHPV